MLRWARASRSALHRLPSPWCGLRSRRGAESRASARQFRPPIGRFGYAERPRRWSESAGSVQPARDDVGVRDQPGRDEQTVTIATTLALFVLVLLAAGVVALLAVWVADPSASFWRAFEIATFAAAAGIGLRYLVRHRRP